MKRRYGASKAEKLRDATFTIASINRQRNAEAYYQSLRRREAMRFVEQALSNGARIDNARVTIEQDPAPRIVPETSKA